MKQGVLKRRTPLKTTGWKKLPYITCETPKKWIKKPLKKPLKKATRKTAKQKRRENKEWSCRTADIKFSLWIRARDGECVKCGTRDNLTCSHYWMRSHSGTRFDPDNCDTLCMGPYSNHCHDEWEKRKNLEYKDFKLKQLGIERYEAMERRARAYKERKQAIADCKSFLEHVT